MASVRVGGFASRSMAELARTYLEDQGISAAVIADDAGGTAPHIGHGTGGVSLLVAAQDAAEARRLLQAGAAPDEPQDRPARTSSAVVTAVGRVLLALAVAGLVVATVLSTLPGD